MGRPGEFSVLSLLICCPLNVMEYFSDLKRYFQVFLRVVAEEGEAVEVEEDEVCKHESCCSIWVLKNYFLCSATSRVDITSHNVNLGSADHDP